MLNWSKIWGDLGGLLEKRAGEEWRRMLLICLIYSCWSLLVTKSIMTCSMLLHDLVLCLLLLPFQWICAPSKQWARVYTQSCMHCLLSPQDFSATFCLAVLCSGSVWFCNPSHVYPPNVAEWDTSSIDENALLMNDLLHTSSGAKNTASVKTGKSLWRRS